MDINGRPTVISTFAGTGGSSLGYHWAGFKELLAIDFDAHAVECFKLNFPDVPVWHKSVTDVTGKQIMDFTGIKWGELDVFDGSPPCQGFSTAGKRQVTDPRNDLFMQYCRLISELGPKVFVMENVSGMAKGVMKGKFIQIIEQLKGMNYIVKCKQMNAMYYGVAQDRKRLIFIGVRKDIGKLPQFPIGSSKLVSFGEVMQCGLASDLSVIDLARWRHIAPGGNFNSLPKNLNTKAKFSNAYRKLHTAKPAYTLCKNDNFISGAFFHPVDMRRINILEKKRICSFPDDWKFPTDSEKDITARLGNAVMPKFMQAIANTIKTQTLGIPD